MRFIILLATSVILLSGFSAPRTCDALDHDPHVRRILRVPSEYPTIQSTVDDAVDGDTVLVAPGTYTGNGNRDIDYFGKSIVVTSELGADSTVIDVEGSEDDPHRGFHLHSNESYDARIEGFAVRTASFRTA